MLALAEKYPNATGREYPIGLYIETKQFGFYRDNYGLDIAEMVFNTLKAYGLETVEKSQNKIPVILECFELESLKRLRELTDLPLIFLTKDIPKEELIDMLPEVAKYAHGIGTHSHLVFESGVLEAVRSYGLRMHPWYIRDDMLQWASNPYQEAKLYYDLKLDGLFTEFPHTTLTTFNNLVE